MATSDVTQRYRCATAVPLASYHHSASRTLWHPHTTPIGHPPTARPHATTTNEMAFADDVVGALL